MNIERAEDIIVNMRFEKHDLKEERILLWEENMERYGLKNEGGGARNGNG